MKLNWGILGAAKIALEKVIPAMKHHNDFQVMGIASRNEEKAKSAAEKLGIPKYYGSYEALLADPEIHVIYNPLPNHLHLEWTLKCMKAGKHVLCEKPIALKAEDVQQLIEARDKFGVKAGEAFMVKSHPQWLKAKEIIQKGELGKVKAIQGFFSYYNVNPDNIRNIKESGGGAIWDIGCYPVTTSRFVLDEEPQKVIAEMEFDKNFGTDILTSVIMKFPSAQVTFTVSTQLAPYQRMRIFGDKKELEISIPFNAPDNRPCEIKINPGDIFQEKTEVVQFDTCNQYTIQAEAFSRAILDNKEVPVSLEDALQNTRVLEAIFLSANEGRWVEVKH